MQIAMIFMMVISLMFHVMNYLDVKKIKKELTESVEYDISEEVLEEELFYETEKD